jgi:hypothetical protein
MSHTATGEWKSFELRMRRRRVERLLLRADVAADEGCFDEARACLEEARRLAPGLPAIADIERKLEAPAVQRPASGFRLRSSAYRASAAGVAALALLVIRLWPHASVPSKDLRVLTLEAPIVESHSVAVAESAPHIAAPPAEPAIMPVVGLGPPPDEDVRSRPAVDTADKASVAATVSDVSNIVAAIATAPATAPSIPADTATLPRTETSPSVPDAPSVTAPAPAALSAPAPGPPPLATPTPDAAVRGALDRYAAAYNDLDAAAAALVWPGVNRASLQRAFDGLASQRVSLGDCRIDVNGAAARASCAGSATWSARIGDGSERTEARRWTFDLVRAGGEWRIVNARAQNR